MKTYPAYKESGIEWLGEIPVHWEVKNLKYVADIASSNVDKKSVDGEERVLLCNYVDVYKNEFITPDMPFMQATATKVQIERFLLKKGDVLITKDSEDPSDIAVPAFVNQDYEDVLCGYHLARLRPFDNHLFGGFLFRLFQTEKYNQYFEVNANGITRFGLGLGAIKNVKAPLPPLSEQHSIAAYLDHKTTQIDTLIADKRRLIELYQEERAALINQAVTRGLDPDVPMKDSGIEWLGEIPAHWKSPKLKFVCHFILDGTHGSFKRTQEGYRLLSVRNIISNKFVFRDDDSRISEKDFKEISSKFLIRKSDIQLAIVGATLGKVAIVEEMDEKFVTQRSLATIRSNNNLCDYRFLFYYIKSETYQSYLWRTTGFSAQPGIYLGTLQNSSISLPDINEQFDIVSYLDQKTTQIDTLISDTEKEIQLLEEYRTALISEVVTGKIDVRDKAPSTTQMK